MIKNVKRTCIPNNQFYLPMCSSLMFEFFIIVCMMRCSIWYHLYNLKKVKNTHGGELILVKLQTSACHFAKINTPPWVFFRFFNLYKWYQIAQRITCMYLMLMISDPLLCQLNLFCKEKCLHTTSL